MTHDYLATSAKGCCWAGGDLMPHGLYRSRCRDVSQECTGGCLNSYELKTPLIVPPWRSHNTFWYRKLSSAMPGLPKITIKKATCTC